MTVTRSLPGMPEVAAGAETAGELVAWELRGMKLPYALLVESLEAAGFPGSVARRMLPRHAFARAAKGLADKRIIRKVDESEDTIRFQFTAETLADEGDHLEYNREAVLTLDKATGEVTADDDALAVRAKAALDEQLEVRTANDVTRIIQRLCETQSRADLIPIGKGGTYWVRPGVETFIDKVEALIGQLNGSMTRLPIATPAPNSTAARNIKEAVADKMRSMITELNESVDGFTDEARNKSIESATDRVKLIRFKIQSYAEYLEDETLRLKAEIDASTVKLRAKVAEIVEARNA